MVAVTAPGTKLYAPQARLVDANTNEIIGKAAGKDTPNQADVDLVSAKITLSLNNVCQLQVVLNNQRHKDGLPVFPPWKYNALSRIKFGQRLRLDIRYGGDAWHKMILARVTDLQFSFPQSGAAQLTVVGEDLLSLLKIKPDKEKPYSNRKEDYIVQDVLVRSKAKDLHLGFTGTTPQSDPLKGPLVPWPQLQPLRSITHSKDTSYLQFLQDIADRMDFELFVDFTERLILDAHTDKTNASEVKLHFEPARSVVKPKDPLPLTWGTNLVEFTPKLKVWEQLTGVTVGGTSHGQRKRHSEHITPDDADVKKDLQLDDEHQDKDLLTAGQVRSKFFAKEEGAAPPNAPSINTSNLDPDRIKLKGIATLRKSMRELLTAEGSTIGLPELRPGIHIKIGGLYPPFDGLYYVTQTLHTFDTSGYHTQFSVRRPGILDPALYPGDDT